MAGLKNIDYNPFWLVLSSAGVELARYKSWKIAKRNAAKVGGSILEVNVPVKGAN